MLAHDGEEVGELTGPRRRLHAGLVGFASDQLVDRLGLRQAAEQLVLRGFVQLGEASAVLGQALVIQRGEALR